MSTPDIVEPEEPIKSKNYTREVCQRRHDPKNTLQISKVPCIFPSLSVDVLLYPPAPLVSRKKIFFLGQHFSVNIVKSEFIVVGYKSPSP